MMSSGKEGWLSTVTKLFSGGEQGNDRLADPGHLSGRNLSDNSSRLGSPRKFVPVNGSPLSSAFESGLQSSRNLRYLSPSVLDRGVFKPSASKPVPTEDIFVETSTTSRKRAFMHDQRAATAVDNVNRDGPKRSRREQFTSSMLEEVTPLMFTDRLNSTWFGRPMEDSSSCIEFGHSPCSSNRSLIERIGSTRSNTSSLSSKTKAILSHLERISTPAREARKLPVMRGSTVPSERWAPMHSSVPPPLLKSSATVPSRIQLLSSSLASQRKPYWRDITRKFQEKEKGASPTEIHDKPSSSLVHPLFDMDKNGCNTYSSAPKTLQKSGVDLLSKSTKSHEPSVKGSDGKSISSNVFNASLLVDEEVVDASEDKIGDLPLFAPPIKAAPSAGFLDDMVFSFSAPVERLPGQNVNEKTSVECDRTGSDGSESSSDESDNEQGSSTSDAEEANEQGRGQKPSRPPTSADSETSGAVSSNITPISSKDVSPQTKTETSWSCPDCFITNKNVSICAACGHNRDTVSGSKTLISNISTIAKPGTSGFRFGFASEESKDNSIPSTGKPPTPKEASGGTDPSFAKPADPALTTDSKLNSTSVKTSTLNITSTVGAAPKANETDKKRTAWECPDCMVQNKETDDNCVCCGHVMYKPSGDSSSAPASVFGDRAFKAVPFPSTGVSFGFGASNSASVASGGIKFGFGVNGKQTSAAKEEAAVNPDLPKEDAPVQPDSSIAAKDTSTTKSLSTPIFETSIAKAEETKSQPPAFSLGAGAAIFGAGAKPPLFGSSSSSVFSPSFSTGSLLKPPSSAASVLTSAAAPAASESHAAPTTAPAPFVFGAASSLNGTKPFGLFENKKDEGTVAKALAFGSGATFGSTSGQVSSSSGIPGPTSNTDSTGKSIVGSSSSSSLFGSTTKPIFPSFGSSTDSKSSMGGVTTTSIDSFKPSPFGNPAASSELQKPPLFGACATTSAVSKPLFGANTAAAAPAANGGLTFSFGSNSNTFGTFNGGGSSASLVPSMPSASSTTPLFGSVPAASNAPKPFQFGTTIPEPTFQFGQPTAFSGSTPFQFGSSQSTTPAAPTFQVSGITGPAAPSSNFSFTSSGTRKMVAARRRLPQRK